MTWISNLWQFSRPHTIIGTTLSILALYFIALSNGNIPITSINLIQLLGVWIACICGNIYIVGLNQLEDIEIDKINKPELPLASEVLSKEQGKWIVIITGLTALVTSGLFGTYLLATVTISLIIGTAYSLPPIRLKQFPFLAAFCIFTVRGVVVNLGLFLHFSQTLMGQKVLPLSVWTLTLFVVVFTIAIALFKDVPDLEGDKQFNISTFSILLGKLSIFNLSRWIITSCYLGMIIAGIFWLPSINSAFLIVSHLILLALLWWRSQNVDLEEKSAIVSFYQFIWKLFFLEYLLFPLAYFV